ncbi:phosphoribosyltransferase [Pseudomonas sp. MDT1-16]
MIGALPSSLREYVERIERAISRWPIHVSLDQGVNWVLQFDPEDYQLAVMILEHLDVLGSNELRSALNIAHTKLVRRVSEKGHPMTSSNTLFAGIGSSSKSGSLISYHYRIAAEISDDDFLDDDEEILDLSKIENIVLVDDVIGTGHTVAKELSALSEEIHSLSRPRNIFVLAVAGYEEGIKHVVEQAGATVVCALEYSNKDTVANLDSRFYQGLPMAERSVLFERLKKYCRLVSKWELGYGEIGGFLVFDHNTPNTTLPVVWGRGMAWTPLFPRADKIPGSAKIIKSAAVEREKDTQPEQQAKKIERSDAEITIFVEGKDDEALIDTLAMNGLAETLGVKSVSSVALGGIYHSQRLQELLAKSHKFAIYVLEEDLVGRSVVGSDLPIIYMQPSLYSLLDIQQVYNERDMFPGLPLLGDMGTARWYNEFEKAIKIRNRKSRESQIELFSRFLDSVAVDQFTKKLNSAVDQLLERAPK